MAIQCSSIQSSDYQKRTRDGTTGNECQVCGRQTAGKSGALFVSVDHCTSEYVTDAEAAERGDDRVSLYPIGPECAKKWRKAIGPGATCQPLAPVENAIDQPTVFLNSTDRKIEKYGARGMVITDRGGNEVATVLPDAEGWFHHHAEYVRQQVQASLGADIG